MTKKNKVEKRDAAVPVEMDQRSMLMISRALADPTRVEVLRRIASSESSSCTDMRECLAMKPATLSHHMKQLESAGLIETTREGRYVRAAIRRKVWKSYLSHLKQMMA